jgi:hypothetical protein
MGFVGASDFGPWHSRSLRISGLGPVEPRFRVRSERSPTRSTDRGPTGRRVRLGPSDLVRWRFGSRYQGPTGRRVRLGPSDLVRWRFGSNGPPGAASEFSRDFPGFSIEREGAFERGRAGGAVRRPSTPSPSRSREWRSRRRRTVEPGRTYSSLGAQPAVSLADP